MTDFQVGDIVKLKSGSPNMTVKEYNEDGEVICVWFVDGKNTVAIFPEGMLNKVSENTGGNQYLSGVRGGNTTDGFI